MILYGGGVLLIFGILLFWLISLPLYIGGQIVRTTKYQFKTNGMPWVKMYIFIFFVAPWIFYLNHYYLNYKKQQIDVDGKYIILDLYEVEIVPLVILVFLLFIRLFTDMKKGLLNVFNVLIIGMIILIVQHIYHYSSAYNGIHEEIGIVSSDSKGKKYITRYEDIESVYVNPYIETIKKRNRYFIETTKNHFEWKVVFRTKNQNEKVYDFYASESKLNSTLRIKEVVIEKGIPLIIEEMDQDTLEYFDKQLEIESLDKDIYYDLFEINNY